MNSYKQSLYSGIIRITANLLMIGAVFLAMYMAAHTPGGSVMTFCGWFFGVSIPVWMLAGWLTRRIRRLYPAEELSWIELPGQGATFVKWTVCGRADTSIVHDTEPGRAH